MPEGPHLSQIESEIGRAMLRDQFRLRRRHRELSKTELGKTDLGKTPATEAYQQWERALEASQRLREERLARMPKPRLDRNLPIFDHAETIKAHLAQHQVVVLSGETGSGKSTQLPLLALELGLGAGGLIGHTQPRRIAARSVAARLAEQLGTPIGTDVGFKIRFADQTQPHTFIKLMTDGILLAETQGDRFLEQYEMLIIDEAHERSLNIDFILGFLKNLLPKRRDLKIVITSATIDTERFAEHFCNALGNPAPILHVEGRTYPVEIRYAPPAESEEGDSDNMASLVSHCRELIGRRDGDVLVFLPTEMDIRNATKKLRGALTGSSIEILPLYARLSPAQQNEIFQPHSRGRIVLATNVAESSITVPGIRYVVDTGTARISRYAARSKVQRLPVEPISQASANQRAGRCGRVAPGVCVRLYSEQDFLTRSAFTTPEIRRTNLAGTILQLLVLGFGNIETFPFLDPPTPESIRDGYKTLFEIGAVDGGRRLTPLGRQLSRLPVDPRIGRMLFAAQDNGCLSEMLIIASALELQDPRVRPAEKQAAADAAHRAWNDNRSDFMAILNLWDFIHKLKTDLSRGKFRVALEKNFLSYSLVLQWQDIHRQLMSLATETGLKGQSRKNNYDAIHQSLLAGLLSSVAMLEDRHEFLGAGGVKFHLWPGSGVFQSKPKWIMAGEIIETTRRYGRNVASIEPNWIFPLAEHLLKHSYVDPFWSAKSQTAMAYQNSSLYGLPVRSRQRVPLAKIDPETSRELFIEQALVEGELRHEFAFYIHNQLMMEDVANLANKTRQRQFVMDNGVLAEFYHKRLPTEATDVRSLQELLKRNPALDEQLCLTYADLGIEDNIANASETLPDAVQVGSIVVPVAYRFQPGAAEDGATIQVPVEALGHVDDTQLGWLIPGLLRDRVVAMIRSLPKTLRRNLVLAPDVADQVIKGLKFASGSLAEQVAKQLTRIGGEPILPSQFDMTKVDPHLLVNIEVRDNEGQVKASGRSLAELHGQLGPEQRSQTLTVDDSQWNQSGLKEWSWGDLPDEIEIQRGQTRLVTYPAVMDEGESVGLRLVDSQAKANSMSMGGINRLLSLQFKKNIRSQIQWLPGLDAAKVKMARWLKPEAFITWLGMLLPRMGLLEGQPLPRSLAEYQALAARANERISVATQDVATWLPKLADSTHDVALALERLPAKFDGARADIREQLQFLFAQETLDAVPWRWLQHYPRYLRGISMRMQKLPTLAPGADRELAGRCANYRDQYAERRLVHTQNGWVDPELDQFRWMIEEYRVSLFAQQLGTSLTISDKRLQKQFEQVRRV